MPTLNISILVTTIAIAFPLSIIFTYYIILLVASTKDWLKWLKWTNTSYDYQTYKPDNTIKKTGVTNKKTFFVGAKKGPIIPPHASFFSKINGESLQSKGPLEDRYLSLVDQRDYLAQQLDKKKAAPNKAEQNRIVTEIEEKIANEKVKTYH